MIRPDPRRKYLFIWGGGGPMNFFLRIFIRNLKNNRVLEEILCCSMTINSYL